MQEGEAVGGEQGQQLIEEASPISSRPPASASVNLDEFMGLSDGGDRGPGVGGGGGSSGNRWPRQETLALLKIRSDMDASFRDATLKGPLWEDVSRKLTELGYKRSAKKCKEKFENVHKYYKRTKEGRAGRQDGKSYKFFTQLEALHGATTQTANQFVAAVNPIPISSFRVSPSISTTPSKLPSTSTSMPMFPPPDITKPVTHANTTASTASIFPARVISFSSNSSSSSPSSQDDDDDEDDDLEGEPSTISRKRKRESWKESSHRMMEFFENLMKQVMRKQEAMQQKFLEIIEEREKDRMIREEAWKRQEMARLSRENELMTRERAMSASRDAAIISFLQKITGQTIQLPPPADNIHHPAPPASAPPPRPAVVPSLTRQQQLQQQKDQQRHKHQSQCTQKQQQPSAYTDQIAVAVNAEQHATPQLEFTGGPGIDTITTTLEATSSSRWPKAEVVALINLRSGLESRYQEAGPKGPLWEEISAGMQRMGYKRSAKRCKEKWENINKYFKKIKESNKKRPDVSKTCPYFHQLDALYLKKVNTIGSSSAHAGGQHSTSAAKRSLDKGDAETSMAAPNQQPMVVRESENKTAATTDRLEITSSLGLPSSFYGEGTVVQGASEKPEDIVKELMEQQENHRQQPPVQQHLIVEDYDKTEEPYQDIEQEDEDEDEDDDEELEDHGRKMAYKIELIERQKATGTSATGGGNGAPSFLAMVQ